MEKTDWYTSLSEEQKRSIQHGLEDLSKGKIISDKEVKALVKAKIKSLKEDS